MKYIGSELEIFKEATNWKSYWASQLSPFLRGSVLEVGAGIGGSTRALLDNAPQSKIDSWTCLEPDPELFKELEKASSLLEIKPNCQQGFLNDIPAGKVFDTILYLDVLEHIEDHEDELARAAKRLDSGGSLVVLVPAHDFLFSEFGRSIGHFRRYSKSTLLELTPDSISPVLVRYLDSVGVAASLLNKFVLQQPYPTRKQILFWDRVLVKFSRLFDRCIFYTLGKSVLVVWQKNK